MRFLNLTLGVIIILNVLGCQFNLIDPDIQPVKATEEFIPQIHLNFDNDTIIINKLTQFEISSDLAGDSKMLGGEVFINEKVVFTFLNKFSFQIDPRSYASGTYELKVVIATTSGNNSLADKLGEEISEVTEKWIIIIDKEPPPPLKLNHSIKDGKLFFTWEKPENENIQSYNFVIKKKTESGYVPWSTYSIDKYKKNEFIDYYYFGGEYSYQVDIISDYYEQKGEELIINYKQILDMNYQIEGEEIIINWKGSNFHGHIREILFYHSYGVEKLEPHITSINVKRSLFFGNPAEYKLQYRIGPPDTEYLNDYIIETSFSVGSQMIQFYDLNYNAITDNYYAFSRFDENNLNEGNYMHLLDNDLRWIKSRKINDDKYSENPTSFSISESGVYAYIADDLSPIIYRVNPYTLEVLNTYDFSSLMPRLYNSIGPQHLNVTNENSLSFTYGINIYIINMDNTSEYSTIERPTNWGAMYLVPGRDKFVHFSSTITGFDLYTVQDKTLIREFEYPESFLFLKDKDILLLGYKHELIVYQISINEIIKTYDIPSLKLKHDKRNDKVYIQSNRITSYEFDCDALAVIETYNLFKPGTVDAANAYLFSGKYISIDSLNLLQN